MKAAAHASRARPSIRAIASRRRLLAVTGAAAVVLLAIPVTASSAQFVWNLSPSAPGGLYRIERGNWTVGDRVAVLPSQDLAVDLAARGVLPNGKLLIKRVVAATGDRVCRQQLEVSVNNRVVAQAKSTGTNGSPLPSWRGCTTLDDGQVFLLGDTAGSYDGRYFGVTPRAEILGQAMLVLAF
jgi:conjugative transfer signal peptidase TraF